MKKEMDAQEPFVMLDNKMLDSAAWTAMSANAHDVYIELKKNFNYVQGGFNHLILTYSQISWRMSGGTYSRVLLELQKYGFIEIVSRGGLFRNPNVFKTSDKWEKISEEIFDKKGKYAIQKKLSKKPTHRDNAKNLPTYVG